jgi:hypothetical protein
VSEHRKFQLNIKFGAGYEAPLLNIEGDSAEEFPANFKFATDSVQALVQATTLFQAAYNVAKPQDVPAAPAPAAAPAAPAQTGWNTSAATPPPAFVPAAAPAAAPAGVESCVHGPMKYQTSKPGASKSWQAWFCPTPKNTPGQCEPKWIRD